MSSVKVTLNKKELELIKVLLEKVRDERFEFKKEVGRENNEILGYIDKTYFKFIGLYDKSVQN